MAKFCCGTINLKKKSVKAEKCEDMNKAVFKWFMSTRSNNTTVSGLWSFKRKQVILKKKFDIGDFQALNGSVDRWKAQDNVTIKTKSGEAKLCTPEIIVHWRETHL